MADDRISFDLSRAEALVLFDWISRFNEREKEPFDDQAEQRVLWDIECLLEARLVEPFREDYDKLLEAARAAVRDSE